MEVIGGLIALAILLVKWWLNETSENRKEREETDRNIDKANDADSLLREFDRLRHK